MSKRNSGSIRILAEESILNEKDRIDLRKLKPIIYDEEQVQYLAVGEKVADAFRTGMELITESCSLASILMQDVSGTTTDYDFSEEKKFSYKGLSMDEIIHHLAVFISRLWQIHVFGDGKTGHWCSKTGH